MSNIVRWIFGLPATLAGFFISAFAGEMSARIISWLINHFWSFILNRGHRKRGHMLSARDLELKLSDKTMKLMFKECSCFPDALVLEPNMWLEIKATIDLLRLSPDTNYAAVLIFKIGPHLEGMITFLEASVSLEEYFTRMQWTKVLCTEPELDFMSRNKYIGFPVKRRDGWMELEMGQFYCDGGAGKIMVGLKECITSYTIKGLIVAGIELRPI